MARPETSFERLLVASTLREMPARLGVRPSNHTQLSESEMLSLLADASRLALSEAPLDRKRAFEVASRVVQVTRNSAIALACQALLARLGNFVGMRLIQPRTENLLPPILTRWEAQAHQVVNTVDTGRGGKVVLTDFQKRVYDALRSSSNVSFSGPTSAGKSFVLALELVQRVLESKSIIVYLVPTRALIREVMLRIRQRLETYGVDIPVRSIPVPLKSEQARQGGIFVLTQERLLTLLYSAEGRQTIDVLVVDEAQSIGEGARGVVLHSAIETALAFNPELCVYFGCPLASNPNLLLSLFASPRPATSFIEQVSPVTQNLILVSRIKGKPTEAEYSLLHSGQRLDLGVGELPFRSTASIPQKRSQLANLVTNPDDATIIYANGRAEAEDIAAELAAELPPAKPTADIREGARFLRDHIHPKYPLTELLGNGVAVHYGSMPGIVRNLVEDLFKNKQVRFIVTTSTLLQGVNLPARNIVIHKPRRGKEHPLTAAEFRNLAGRAGRLAQEFHGNVWILHPHEWEEASYEGPELNPVVSSFNQAMDDGGTIAIRALEETPLKGEADYGVATLGKLYTQFGPENAPLEASRYATPENQDQIRQTSILLQQLKVAVPPEVLQRNSTMHPVRLGGLAEWMRDQPIQQIMPLHPKRPGSYDQFEHMVHATQYLLERDESGSYTYYTFLAWRWISSMPLRLLLDAQLRHKRDDPYNARMSDGALLTEILQEIEDIVRYRLVRNLRAYTDVLRSELVRRGLSDMQESIPPLHLFLECGTANQAELNLISIGLSRTTAILLGAKPYFTEEQSPEQTLQVLRSLPRVAFGDLPEACRAEIRAFVGN